MAWIIKPDGGIATEIDAKDVTLEKAQEVVGGYVERLRLLDSSVMLVNEEGKIHGLPVNTIATAMYNFRDTIVGTVVFMTKKEAGRRWG